MTRQNTFWVALFSILMFCLSWPPIPFSFLLLVAFVPLLIGYSKLPFRYWIFAVFIALFGWNTFATYWIYYTLPVGAFFTHLINSMIFTLPFLVFSYTESKTNRGIGFLNFGLAWISLEYLQLNWELSYPFLNLGNGLAMYPWLFQWYEYTGAIGGSLWILTTNILISELINKGIEKEAISLKMAISIALVVLLPTIFSVFKFETYEEMGKKVAIIAINPAVDCYTEKYTKDINWLIDKYLASSTGEASDFILWPETAIPDAGLADQLITNPYLETVKDKLAPNTVLIAGAIVYTRYGKDPRDKENKTFYPALDEYLSVHNAAVEIQKNSPTKIVRTKRNLVPFEESTPYPEILNTIKRLLGSLGGFRFSYLSAGKGYSESKGTKATPLICYEILFGDEVAVLSFRSNIFFLLLNEGWYRNKTGSLQFLYYTSLRAVETRRSIARSSNMGISALIDQRGVIVKRIDKIDESSVLTGSLQESDKTTFYALAGDLIGKIAAIALISLNILLISFQLGFLKRKPKLMT